MRRPVIGLLCGVMLLGMLACGAYALSGGDSLISLSYLTGTFVPKAVSTGNEAAEKALQGTYEESKKGLDNLHQGYLAQLAGEESGAYSATLQARDWSDGDEMTLTTGAGVMLMNGAASVSHDGAFIDVTDGIELASGARLTSGHRYLVGENTVASVTVLSGAAQLGLQGVYALEDGREDPTPFYDVCQTDWYYAPVDYVYRNTLFSGMDEHHFGPSSAMNRAMLMTVLYQMAGAPKEELERASVTFADVPESAWYAPYVKWGAEQGITAGTGADTFSPEQQVTRQQVAALLYSFTTSYLGLEAAEGADLSGYQDLGQASDWAHNALSWAVAEGLISSSSADSLTLSPQKSANRAEVATMLRAFAEKII